MHEKVGKENANTESDERHLLINHLRRNATSIIVDHQEGGDNPMDRELAAVLTFVTLDYRFECHTTPDTLRPYIDCINLISAYCQSYSRIFISMNDCHTKIRMVRDRLNSNWKSWINSCFLCVGGNSTSQRCTNATNNLLTNGYYVLPDGTNVNVPLSVVKGAEYLYGS